MRKIFTLLAAFLAIAGSAVWGQDLEFTNDISGLFYAERNLSDGTGRSDINMEVHGWKDGMQVRAQLVGDTNLPEGTEFAVLDYNNNKEEYAIALDDKDGFWIPQNMMYIRDSNTGTEENEIWWCSFSFRTKVTQECRISIRVSVYDGQNQPLLTTGISTTAFTSPLETDLVNMEYMSPNGKSRNMIEVGDTFSLKAKEGFENEKVRLLIFSANFEYEIIETPGRETLLPTQVRIGELTEGEYPFQFSGEAYVVVEDGELGYYYSPETGRGLAYGHINQADTAKIAESISYKGEDVKVEELLELSATGVKYLIIPSTVKWIRGDGRLEADAVEFLGDVPPTCENDVFGLKDDGIIIVRNESAKKWFEEQPAFNRYTIKTKEEATKPSSFTILYNIEGNGSIAISYDGKPAASYTELPDTIKAITVTAEPLMGSKLSEEAITITEGDSITKVSSGDTYTLLGQGSLSIAATFVKDEGNTAAADSLSQAPEVVADATEITEVVTEPTAIGAFDADGSAEVKIVSTPVEGATAESIIEAYKQEEPSVSIPEDGQTYALDITPMYITSDGTIKEATVSTEGESVSIAFPYPEGLGADDFEDIAVLHMKKNGEFEYFSEGNNLELKETHIELSGITSFSPFVLIYTKAEVDPEPEIPEFTTYYDLHITQSVGAKLVSRHGKDQVEEGGSFTLSLEKEEGYEDCNPTVYVKRGRSGEWQEVKLDEVSGYYQIRDVYTDIYVKVSGDGIYPVGNESIETSDTKVYSLNGMIVVETAQPKEVYVVTLAGAVVANAQVVGKQTFDNLATGVYIVRAGETIVKLQVRN